ncbi:MAG: hypothetical protein QOG00_3198 [Pyrinomonadaceae bacterium]|nr:hypothetical protein [Pyrinomonadaceae bacterium]
MSRLFHIGSTSLAVRGEAAYLAFIMLKAKEVCSLLVGVQKSDFNLSYAMQRDVLNCIHAIGEADNKITAQVKRDLDISWELLCQIKALDKSSADDVWNAANNLIPKLRTAIESLNLQFVAKTAGMDSLHLAANTQILEETEFSFFHDEPGFTTTTAAEQQESQLAAWLLDNHLVKQWLNADLGLPENSFHLTGVTKPILAGNEEVGDIDALLASTNNLSEAVAVECKRVKAVITNGVAAINGTDNIKKGIRQANALHSLGFFRTWLAIIVITDGRGDTECNFMFRGLPDRDFSNLFKRTYEYAICGKRKLHDDIGVVFFEIVQTKDKAIDHSNNIKMCVCRDAVAVEQRNELSEQIKALIEQTN